VKLFKITDRRYGSDVLGGPVSERNPYVAYARPEHGQKHPIALDVGESSRCAYTLSSGRGVYVVTRIEDGVSS
jgi:hypothetical protein